MLVVGAVVPMVLGKMERVSHLVEVEADILTQQTEYKTLVAEAAEDQMGQQVHMGDTA